MLAVSALEANRIVPKLYKHLYQEQKFWYRFAGLIRTKPDEHGTYKERATGLEPATSSLGSYTFATSSAVFPLQISPRNSSKRNGKCQK